MPVPNPLIPASVVTNVIDPLLADLRSTTCQLKRPSSGRSVGGAPVTGGYVNEGAPVSCRVLPATGITEAIRGGRFIASADYEVWLHRDTVVGTDYQIVPADTSEVLEVIGDDDIVTHGLELRVFVSKQR